VIDKVAAAVDAAVVARASAPVSMSRRQRTWLVLVGLVVVYRWSRSLILVGLVLVAAEPAGGAGAKVEGARSPGVAASPASASSSRTAV